MALDKSKFIATFVAEAEGYLTGLNQGLVRLEADPKDSELLQELFRLAHTLKGASRMMGFNQIREIAHRIEDVFGLLSEGKQEFNSTIADAVFSALDMIKKALDNIKKSGEEKIETGKVIGALAKSCGAELEPEPASKISNAEPEAVPSKAPEPSVQSALSEEYIRVPVSRVNRLLNLIGEMVINKVRAGYRANSFKKLNSRIKTAEKMLFEFEGQLKDSLDIPDEVIHFQGSILRASQELEKYSQILNRLHQIEATLGLLKGEMADVSDDIQTEAFQFGPIIEELQQRMKEIRMLPCATIFEGFPRMIRDIAHEQGKDVVLVIKGEETELDKKVLETIKAPLIHILRNSIDHGIESGEERRTAGKDATGRICLTAFQEKGSVIIEVEDDGAGIDLERVRETAVRKNIATTAELEQMTEEGVLNLIYAEGFSTSPMITDVSGRGIGLDVVRKEMERLKGAVDITSKVRVGTRVRLTLPLTIAIMRVLIVESGGVRWGVPLSDVEESIHVPIGDISTIENNMIVQVRSQSVPLVRLTDVLNIQGREAEKKKKQDSDLHVVVTSSLKKRVGFIVDRICGEEEIFIKNVGHHLGKVRGVSGATVLASGEVVVILDIQDLILQAQMAHPAIEGRRKKKAAERKRKLLVVEDSLTTRELEKTILENNGYEVEVAIDGLDALDKLSKVMVDLVVTDIKMPRMDGFELCKSIKTSEKLKNIPVVFVTALSKDEEKRKGIDVGGQAYIVKSQFDQGNLLDTIERLI